MKKRRIVLVSIVFILSLFYCVCALADGGGPLPLQQGDPCKIIPKTIDYDGPLITGTFTASWDASQCTVNSPAECRHYNIHVLLEGIKLEQGLNEGRELLIKKLYYLHTKIHSEGTGANTIVKSLCEYTLYELKNKFKYAACKEGVAQYFGFVKEDANGVDKATHYPVVTDVWVTQRDNCNDYSKVVISGTIKIRMTTIEDGGGP